MSSAAVCIGHTILYWDAILIALSACACYLAIFSAYTANGGRAGTLCVFVPLSLALAVGVSRLMFWLCHPEQFASLSAAFLPGSGGSVCLSGVVIGFALAAALLRLLRLAPDAALLFDSCAPGLALGLALVRLSALFNGSCRGKLVITDPRFARLPFAAPAPGAAEYRFAAFFVSSLLFLAVFVIVTLLYLRLWGRPGDAFLVFLLLYNAVDMLIDSTRYDATYFLFNGFVSVAQILGAVTMLGVTVLFSVRARRAGTTAKRRVLCWIVWFLGLGAAGVSEYLVQRHGNWPLRCYALMSFGLLLTLAAALLLYRPARKALRERPL